VFERSSAVSRHEHVLHSLAGDVAALEKGGVDARLEDRVASLASRLLVDHGDVGQYLGLVDVGRRQRRLAEQVFVGAFGFGLEQAIAGGRDHHGIDHERELELARAVGDGPNDVRGREHSRLRRADREVVGDGRELGLDRLERKDV